MSTAAPAPGTEAREEFGARALEVRAETAAVAVAATAKAQVEARYIVAMKNRRDLMQVRDRILLDCQRPMFAAVARYRKPIGKGVEGPSIRFVESALRNMGNIDTSVATVYDDPMKRIVRVSVTDLETNVTYPKDVVIDKTVERRTLKDGQTPISVRTNSAGERTYLVPATDDDLLNKENALVSKALRTLGLRIIPGDIVEEAMELAIATTRNRDAQDPAAAQKRIADSFASLNVQPAALREYLGHDLATCTPADLADLRAVYAAVQQGEVSWHEVLAARVAERGEAEGKGAKGAAGLKEKLAKTKDAPAPAPAPSSPPATPPAAGGALFPGKG